MNKKLKSLVYGLDTNRYGVMDAVTGDLMDKERAELIYTRIILKNNLKGMKKHLKYVEQLIKKLDKKGEK